MRKAVFAAESKEVAETIAQGQAMINWHRNNLYSPFSGLYADRRWRNAFSVMGIIVASDIIARYFSLAGTHWTKKKMLDS